MQRTDLARWSILPMRLLVGFGFMEHGFAKLSRGPDAFAGISCNTWACRCHT